MKKTTSNVYMATIGLQKALAEGTLLESGTEYIDLEEGTYAVDYTFDTNRNTITIDEVLYCQPTGRTHNGKPLLECVETDFNPLTAYNELVEMYS